MFHELFATYIAGTDGSWQSYGVFTAPVNWRFESGDRVELNIYPQGENLIESFDISSGLSISPGQYHFNRYRIELQSAPKRPLNAQMSWWFGSFYNGSLDELSASINYSPSPLFNFQINGVRNVGSLPNGDFQQTLAGFRVRYNVTTDLQVNSFLQYDSESKILGWNARVHWIFSPLGDAFLVFNYNTLDEPGHLWTLQNQQMTLKVRYLFRA
jgi:hypothetical protein